MTNYDSRKDESLDRALDAALAQYAAVEPRPGLEERILANLEGKRNRAPLTRWWAWPALAAAVILITLTLVWRWNSQPASTARRAPTATQDRDGGLNRAHAALNGNIAQSPFSASVKISHRIHAHSPVLVASVPRLDQFPSPRPLSEQEQILARYVASYPQQAALLAQAHAEALRQDLADDAAKHRAVSSGDSPQ